ncbi:MAG: hypothetical protein ACOZF0_08670 [Thermodesulfobacteriota bacterium]
MPPDSPAQDSAPGPAGNPCPAETGSDRTPIVFSRLDSHEYHNGWALACDAGGMSFESRTALPPGARIVIKMMNYCMIMEAEVTWCREDMPANPGLFRMGARFDRNVLA